MRPASGTPRVGMPNKTMSPLPRLRSRISWVMRVSARAISRSSRTSRPSWAPGGCESLPASGPFASVEPVLCAAVLFAAGLPESEFLEPLLRESGAYAMRTSFAASRDGGYRTSIVVTVYHRAPMGPRQHRRSVVDGIADNGARHAVAAAASSAQFGTYDGDDLDTGFSQERIGIRVAVVSEDHARLDRHCVIAAVRSEERRVGNE